MTLVSSIKTKPFVEQHLDANLGLAGENTYRFAGVEGAKAVSRLFPNDVCFVGEAQTARYRFEFQSMRRAAVRRVEKNVQPSPGNVRMDQLGEVFLFFLGAIAFQPVPLCQHQDDRQPKRGEPLKDFVRNSHAPHHTAPGAYPQPVSFLPARFAESRPGLRRGSAPSLGVIPCRVPGSLRRSRSGQRAFTKGRHARGAGGRVRRCNAILGPVNISLNDDKTGPHSHRPAQERRRARSSERRPVSVRGARTLGLRPAHLHPVHSPSLSGASVATFARGFIHNWGGAL